MQKGARLREILPSRRKYVFETSARTEHPRYHSNCDITIAPRQAPSSPRRSRGLHGKGLLACAAFFLPARKIQMLSALSFAARTNRRFSVTIPIPGHSPSSLFVSFSFYALILLHIARPVKREKTEYSSFSSKFIVKGRPSAPFGRLFGLFGISALYQTENRRTFARIAPYIRISSI